MKRFYFLAVIFIFAFCGCENYVNDLQTATVQGFSELNSVVWDKQTGFSIDSLFFASGKKSYILKGNLLVDDTLRNFNVISDNSFFKHFEVRSFKSPIDFQETPRSVQCTVQLKSNDWCEVEWRSGSKRIFLRNKLSE